MVLILLNLLSIICRVRPWGPGRVDTVRVILNVAVGLGLCLSALITLNDDYTINFMETPWILPTLCLTFFVILLIDTLPSLLPSPSKLRHRMPRAKVSLRTLVPLPSLSRFKRRKSRARMPVRTPVQDRFQQHVAAPQCEGANQNKSHS